MPKWLAQTGLFHVDAANYSANCIDSGELESSLLKSAERLQDSANKIQEFAPRKFEAYNAKAGEILKLANSVTEARISYEASLKAVVEFNWATSVGE